jgi:hypothetical protein
MARLNESILEHLRSKARKSFKKRVEEVQEAKKFSGDVKYYEGMVPLDMVRKVAVERCYGDSPTVRDENEKVREFVNDIRGAQMIYQGE